MKRLVDLAEEMDDETFIKHMNKRHKDSLGGLPSLWMTDDATHRIWRAFHRRLHQLRVDLRHEHA